MVATVRAGLHAGSSDRSGAACYAAGVWHDGNVALIGPMDHAFWMSSVVFDGARAFGGLAPDLDLHCGRLFESAATMALRPKIAIETVIDLCRQGVRKFPADAELYIRPAFYATAGFVVPEPDSTEFALAVHEAPMPEASGFSACLSTRRRPSREAAPTDAKASCLYPNISLSLAEARERGFESAIALDPNGNVAEFATSNLWFARDGVAYTPAENGTFLAGITRMRVMALLREAGVEIVERAISFAELLEADEVFSTGNYAKVSPVTRIEGRDYQPGPVAAKARALYFEFAKSCSVL